MLDKSKIGKERFYSPEWTERGRTDVIFWDVQPIAKQQLVKVTFISRNSPHLQGVRFGIDYGKGGIEVDGCFYPRDYVAMWGDNAGKEVVCKCITNKGFLSIYNEYYVKGENQYSAQSYGCGMILEERDSLLIYHCNDYGFETNFDKLVFSLELLPGS
jgi:hypothetical protein